jgi:hypothetical protein
MESNLALSDNKIPDKTDCKAVKSELVIAQINPIKLKLVSVKVANVTPDTIKITDKNVLIVIFFFKIKNCIKMFINGTLDFTVCINDIGIKFKLNKPNIKLNIKINLFNF